VAEQAVLEVEEGEKKKKSNLWAPYLDVILQFVFMGTDLRKLSFSL
jgi:hypothetical protein